MNKRLTSCLIFFAMALSIISPVPAMAMQTEVKQTGSFKAFREKLAEWAKMPGREASFLYHWGMKRWRKQPTTPEDDAHAKKLLVKYGIPGAVIATIIAAAITKKAVAKYSERKKIERERLEAAQVAQAQAAKRPSKPELDLKKKTGNRLLVAIGNGSPMRVIEEFIPQSGINDRDPNGATALMVAVVAGRPEIVRLLIDKGANKDLKTYTNNLTALRMAQILKEYHEQMAEAATGEYYKQLNRDLVTKFEQIEGLWQ